MDTTFNSWISMRANKENFYFGIETCFCCILDDDQDVHYCGRCKLSFTDLSEYIKHKANRLCREILNKSTLSDVVEKLPIDGNQSKEKSEKKSSDTTESATTNASQKTQADVETPDGSPSPKRVEVQFLEPLVAGESGDVTSSVGKDRTAGHKTVDGPKTGEFYNTLTKLEEIIHTDRDCMSA